MGRGGARRDLRDAPVLFCSKIIVKQLIENAKIKNKKRGFGGRQPPAESASSQLAACEGFLAYAIKGGKIRVLARGSATRTLLRGHSQRIVDLAFGGGAAPGGAAGQGFKPDQLSVGLLCGHVVGSSMGGCAHEYGPQLGRTMGC